MNPLSLTGIPVLKELIGWLRQTELVTYLKEQLALKDKQIEALNRRLTKGANKNKIP
jgi:hypothetical protein